MAEGIKAGSKGSANFMRQFRDKKTRELKNLTASQFMDVWSHYDKDGPSGDAWPRPRSRKPRDDLRRFSSPAALTVRQSRASRDLCTGPASPSWLTILCILDSPPLTRLCEIVRGMQHK
ncbi:hypothetical protein HPB47_007238 [Ixodes persulcatus]|uniref:Uncharacterized protein n=1 Tax=Ixodes persulcatus TaxID=34615 RepID=A0AC60P8P5_IXOPE|nr:hypothetical protein HPB47_007238 [Ixodes persulcatus]